jgi:hypothetical protein
MSVVDAREGAAMDGLAISDPSSDTGGVLIVSFKGLSGFAIGKAAGGTWTVLV